jgi:peptidoglycan/LPS O-acetylase OafA/YrhL
MIELPRTIMSTGVPVFRFASAAWTGCVALAIPASFYPLHFLTLLLAVPFSLFAGKGIDAGQLVFAGGLMQAWILGGNVYFGMNAPSWSLSCEALFYAVFPFLAARLVTLGPARACGSYWQPCSAWRWLYPSP